MLTAAAIVLVVLAALHSGLGELLLFRRLRADATPELGFPPVVGDPQPASAILRACWHLLSLFGLAFAVLVGGLPSDRRTLGVVAATLSIAALVVLVGTRGKHVGWIGFAAAAVLCGLGAR